MKNYAKKHPHSMGEWGADSKSHVAHMNGGDFRSSEKSAVVAAASAGNARIELVEGDGNITILKEKTPLIEGEIIDAAVMSQNALRAFLDAQIEDAKQNGVLFSLHMKATMMKVSDPIIFGHAVSVFFKDVFEKHGAVLEGLGVDPNNGVGDLLAKVGTLPEAQRDRFLLEIMVDYPSEEQER